MSGSPMAIRCLRPTRNVMRCMHCSTSSNRFTPFGGQRAMRFVRLLFMAALTAGGTIAPALSQTIQIDGAGATFPYPIYSKWFSEYNKLHPNVQINYQSIGSGGGIRQLTNQTVFFGATDGPMTNDQLVAAPGKILHFPMVLGGVVPIYNLPDIGADLNFSGTVLADLFLGEIPK